MELFKINDGSVFVVAQGEEKADHSFIEVKASVSPYGRVDPYEEGEVHGRTSIQKVSNYIKNVAISTRNSVYNKSCY